MASGARWATFDCYGTLVAESNYPLPTRELPDLRGLADTPDDLVPQP